MPGYSATWHCEPRTVGRARDLVRAALHTWGLDGLTDRAALVVSELVTNSIQHSGRRMVRVSITLPQRDQVRISVSDKSSELPVRQAPDGQAESGRGLLLVDALADRWETEERNWGKVIRAELHAAPDS
ncbi:MULTISPECIES: ATP-binding protein [Streptomyces]|uniref:ATP-binding protein n=1 Tax=Streptomyces TaxID=1883 RepID=UPI002248898D|nr:ATP-binding protein [Streptomyces sp. JHD 1]MCX2971133.1 ATP-binding protein [Streptomyces sp. JHD 1]